MNLAEMKEAGIRALSDSLLSSIGFVDSLREQGHNKVAFISLDLLIKREMPREQVDDYLTHLRSVIRRQLGAFTHCLGLIRTPPVQEEVGYRIQCVLIFDGEQGWNAIQRGHEVGNHWVNIITEGQGSYFNSNPYRKLGLGSDYGVVSLGAMRWKCHMLMLAMGRADHPLILIGVPRQNAGELEREVESGLVHEANVPHNRLNIWSK